MNIDNYDEDAAADNILNRLRTKVVVKPEFLKDLGDIGGKPTYVQPKKDPSLKMQIRQKKVSMAILLLTIISSHCIRIIAYSLLA